MSSIYAGDVVQLRTGGAPLVVVEVLKRDWQAASGDMLRLVTISAGGLLQETTAQAIAVQPFDIEQPVGTIPPSKDWVPRPKFRPSEAPKYTYGSTHDERVAGDWPDTRRYRK